MPLPTEPATGPRTDGTRAAPSSRRSTLRGPADLGKRVDLAEQSARHGAGDPGRGDALKKDAEGKWE